MAWSCNVAEVITAPCALSKTLWAKGMVGSSQWRATPTSRSCPSCRSICIQSTNPSRAPPLISASINCHALSGPDARNSRPLMAPSSRPRPAVSSASALSSSTVLRAFASRVNGWAIAASAAANAWAAVCTGSGAGCRLVCKSYRLSGSDTLLYSAARRCMKNVSPAPSG